MLDKAILTNMSPLFRISHALAVNARPFTDYVWHCELEEAMGVSISKDYRNDKAARMFTKYIAEVERRKLEMELKKSKFVCVMVDGTTDCSIQEQELVFVRYASKGDINVRFASVETCEKADAASITQAVFNSMTTVGLSKQDFVKKLVGFASDGAAVMQGRNNGVAVRLREHQPKLQSVHCMAHRLELAYRDVLKTVPIFKRMDSFLLGLYLFYHNSALNRSNLKTSFKSMDESCIVPTRVGGTRWMSHTKGALDKVTRGYTALLQHLEQVNLS